ncbi:MAG: lipocalin family protein [Alphaproteobacteria bacterium]
MSRKQRRTELAAAALMLALPFATAGPGMGSYAGPTIDLNKYTGLWYEIARTPNRFQDNEPRKRGQRLSACFNSTAEYRLEGEGRIAVTNTCIREAPDGSVIEEAVRGIALVIEGTGNRRLQVAFGPWIARVFQRLFGPSEGNYWIHCLGPETDGRYAWSVVSDNRREMVWLLAREPGIPEETKAEMRACARAADLPVEKLNDTRRAG